MSTNQMWFIALEISKQFLGRMNRVIKQHRMWRKHVLVSAVTVILGVTTILLMTGVQFFTNDVYITRDGATKKYFTMKEDSGEILTEFGYTLDEFDRVVHEKVDGKNSIEIVKGFAMEITVDGRTFTVSAIEGETYDVILAANSIIIGEYDVVVSGENRINVIRGFGVDVTADGKTVTIGARKLGGEITVSDVLQSADVTVGVGDVINMNPTSGVSEGDEVVVGRVSYRERTHVEPLPYETTVEYSNLVALGETQTTEGEDGELTFVFLEKLVDGAVVTSEVVSRQRTKEPQPKTILHGLALRNPYSQRDFPEIRLENGLPVDYIQVISGKSTAYTAPPTSSTASGRKLEIGTVAVDPRIIPYGSLLYIVTSCGNQVYGAAVAADTGGFIYYEDRFVVADLFMGLTSDSYGEAVRWGARDVDVYIINTGIY